MLFDETLSPQGEWHAVFDGSYEPFLSVLNLQSNFTDDRRLSTEHLLYLGQSRDDNSAVFITMRDVAVASLHQEHHEGSTHKDGKSLYTEVMGWLSAEEDCH